MKCPSWRCGAREQGVCPGSRWGVGSHVQSGIPAGWAQDLPQHQQEGVTDSSGELLLEGTEDTACPPGSLPRMASCLPGAWMGFRETAKACPALGLLLLAVFPDRPQWCCQGDVEQVSSVNVLLWGWGWQPWSLGSQAVFFSIQKWG